MDVTFIQVEAGIIHRTEMLIEIISSNLIIHVVQTSFVINQMETKAVICTCAVLKIFQKSEKNALHVLQWLDFHGK